MIANHRSGRLVTVSESGKSDDGHIQWLCKCDCGGTKIVSSNMLRPNGVQSCGCLRKEAQEKRISKNGVWNDGKSYAIHDGKHCYKTRHAWAKALIRLRGNKCEKCGWDKARCDANHIDPKANGGLHTLENGIVLCPNCHRIEHEAGNVD